VVELISIMCYVCVVQLISIMCYVCIVEAPTGVARKPQPVQLGAPPNSIGIKFRKIDLDKYFIYFCPTFVS
jgi:NMD protein affecting ribosome stability and mRNA decay